MSTHTYKAAAFTMRELVAIRCALREDVSRFLKWRRDPHWRQVIRECIAAYRKCVRVEVEP